MANPSEQESAKSEQEIAKTAQPGKGAAGDRQAVQVSQAVGEAVNPPGTKTMSGGNAYEAETTIAEAKVSEADADANTTGGYVVDGSNRVDNVAVEPEMYVEGEK